MTAAFTAAPLPWQATIRGARLAAAAGLALVPLHRPWPLGLLPLGLGLAKLATAVHAHRGGQRTSPAVVTGLAGVTGLTIANGGDNLSACIPFFRTSSPAEIAVITVVFTAGVGVCCLVSFLMAAHAQRGLSAPRGFAFPTPGRRCPAAERTG